MNSIYIFPSSDISDEDDNKESKEPDYSVEVRIQSGNIVINW
jgi:hypothetical protein